MILRPSQSEWKQTVTGTGSFSWHLHTAGKGNNFSSRSSFQRTPLVLQDAVMATLSEFTDFGDDAIQLF